MANHPPEEKKTSRGRKDLYAIGDQRIRTGGNKDRKRIDNGTQNSPFDQRRSRPILAGGKR